MFDPKQNPSLDEEAQVAERKPELEPEKLKDLTPEDEAEGVKGGVLTGAGAQQCYCGSM